MESNFRKVFPKSLTLIGMIHLAGGRESKIKRALQEIEILADEGFDGALIENYHAHEDIVKAVLEKTSKKNFDIKIGVNILEGGNLTHPECMKIAYDWSKQYGASFIQFDYIAGEYFQDIRFLDKTYSKYRKENPNIVVLGGVHPKYYTPTNPKNLNTDLKDAMTKADAIVVTGAGTGSETPIDKIGTFRKVIGNHPLIVGAGLNVSNAYEQLIMADGAIVGSSIKPEKNTESMIEARLVKNLVQKVDEIRKYKQYV